MVYSDGKSDRDYWDDDPTKRHPNKKGKYIVVSGNTGAGKSSLIKRIEERARKKNLDVIGINERVLHHPLLKLMFSDTKEYGFFVQLNFLLQRHILLYRWLSVGYSVVIERAHFDDYLFVEKYLDEGVVSNREIEAYRELQAVLSEKLPPVDYYLYLDVDPKTSFDRVTKDEVEGVRPKEFPSDEVKISHIESWYNKYKFHYEDIQNRATHFNLENTHFRRISAEKDTSSIEEEIINLLSE